MLKGNGIKVKISDQVLETQADDEPSKTNLSDLSLERKQKKVQRVKDSNFLKVVRSKVSEDKFFETLNQCSDAEKMQTI